jgi:hypothetical protein
MAQSARRSFIGTAGALLAALPLALTQVARAKTHPAKRPQITASAEERLQAMEKQMEQMAAQLGTLEDAQAIRRLQHAYGYYMDKCLYQEVIDLFAEDGEVHFGNGIYRGKDGQRRLYMELFRKRFTGGTEGPVYGFLLDHLQLQDIVDVAPDRRTARARMRCFMQAGSHDAKKDAVAGVPRQWWEGGIYENTYAKGDDGLWRIKVLAYHVVYQGTYEEGWAHWKTTDPALKTFPDNPVGPDEISVQPLPAWPDTTVVPFHYPHPVTGKSWA